METAVMKLTGLNDENGANKVKQALQDTAGVNGVNVSVTNHRAIVEFDENQTSPLELQTVLARVGYAVDTASAQAKHEGCCGGCGGR